MEDAWLAIEHMGDGNSLFGIFDGHGGQEISKFVSNNLEKVLLSVEAYHQHNYEEALK